MQFLIGFNMFFIFNGHFPSFMLRHSCGPDYVTCTTEWSSGFSRFFFCCCCASTKRVSRYYFKMWEWFRVKVNKISFVHTMVAIRAAFWSRAPTARQKYTKSSINLDCENQKNEGKRKRKKTDLWIDCPPTFRSAPGSLHKTPHAAERQTLVNYWSFYHSPTRSFFFFN